MGKFTLAVIIAYILYYAGNIIYDLYIRKEKVVETNETTEFVMEDVSNQQNEYIQNITIDDVENIRVPQSLDGLDGEELDFEEPKNLEDLQKKYEDENNLDEVEQNVSDNLQEQIAEEKKSIADRPIKNLDLKNILNDLKTRVKMVANYDGQKVYNIS